MEKLFYTIGEAADILGESVSLVRFWSNTFSHFIKPQRNAKGNRLFTASDIGTLKQIHYLVKTRGMTLDGAESQMRSDRASVESSVKALESLKAIRAQLVEIRESM